MASPIADQQGDAAAPASPARWPVIDRSLRDRRRSLTGWALGIAVYVGLIVAFWPSIRGSSEISKAIENYPDVMKEFFGGAAAFDYATPGASSTPSSSRSCCPYSSVRSPSGTAPRPSPANSTVACSTSCWPYR